MEHNSLHHVEFHSKDRWEEKKEEANFIYTSFVLLFPKLQVEGSKL